MAVILNYQVAQVTTQLEISVLSLRFWTLQESSLVPEPPAYPKHKTKDSQSDGDGVVMIFAVAVLTANIQAK